MSLTAALNVGLNGMATASLGTAVSGHNVTNASTEGYTRQRLDQKPQPLSRGGGMLPAQPEGVRDAFVNRRLNNAASLDGQASARSNSLQDIDALFEDSEGGLADALDGFETAMADFASQPDSNAARDQVLVRTGALAASFNEYADRLDAAQQDANSRITFTVSQLNDHLSGIARANQEIVAAQGEGLETSTLVDQRDQLVREVAAQLPVTTVEHGGEQISVLLSGSISLVSHGIEPAQLTTGVDANGNATVQRVNEHGNTQDVTGLVTSGAIAGYMEARDGAIADAQRDLDQLAFDVATAYNTEHVLGTGRDSLAGRNLFDVTGTTAGAAGAIAVSADVAGIPDNLAAGTGTWLPGDNTNARRMQALSRSPIAGGGTENASEAFGSLVGKIGNAVQSAMLRADHAGASLSQARSLRDSVSGVSSDEEMISLMKYQRAYQASLRVIETADSMLAELMNLRR